jgi:thiamine pyrophosphokinase
LRAVIFANGHFDKSSALHASLQENDFLIAADGGAQHCLDLELIPDIVIGDMDSIPPQLLNNLRAQGTQIIVYPRDKDHTDLALALAYAVEQGAQEILLFGLMGGRLDQSLANLMLLTTDEWKNLSLVVFAGPDIAYLMHSHSTKMLNGRPGDIVSLIPLSDRVTNVSTQGLRWPLRKADLVMGNTLSVSNEMLDTTAKVQIGIGKMLLVHRDIIAARGKE